jgi:pyrroline-5-carboxylate reductase
VLAAAADRPAGPLADIIRGFHAAALHYGIADSARAWQLVRQTFIGSARFAGAHPESTYDELWQKIATGKGTTAAGGAVIAEWEARREDETSLQGFPTAAVLAAAANRATELSHLL